MTALYIVGIALAAYFLGGINGAIITARLVYGEDIRKHGSGNPGLTNFYRVFGPRAVLLVILIDVLKTAVPVVLGGTLLESWAEFGTVTDRYALGASLAGFCAMLGHAYPCLYQFKGGKCVLAGGTAAIFIDWRIAACVWGAFLLIALLTRYVSLGSIIAGALFSVSALIWGYTGWPLLLCTLGGALVVYRHRENLGRLLRGEERKFSFKRGDKPEAGASGAEEEKQ